MAYQPSVQVLDALGLVKIDDEYNPEEQLTETRRKLYQAQTKKRYYHARLPRKGCHWFIRGLVYGSDMG